MLKKKILLLLVYIFVCVVGYFRPQKKRVDEKANQSS